MGESVDLHEGAGKENEQTLANSSLAEEVTSKDEVEIEKFLQEQKSKNTQYKTKSDLNAWKKFCESQKESTIMRIINLSLSTGVVPDALKVAILSPTLKKSDADFEQFQNVRPMSN